MVTPGQLIIVLIQNGLNIEKPILVTFLDNTGLSGNSFCDSHEVATGKIVHEDDDGLDIGAYRNPQRKLEEEDAAAERFVRILVQVGNAGRSITGTSGSAVGASSSTMHVLIQSAP